jgi:DNA mismatch endonuclease (patch repair protein)
MLADHISKQKRSWNMSRITSKDTKPEIVVRFLLHSLGYRFRLHRKDLPGKPDIVLPKYKTVIFVHGCFWHRHEGCKKATTPKSNMEYWLNKFARNISNDIRHKRELQELGWSVIVIWECETKNVQMIMDKLSFLK